MLKCWNCGNEQEEENDVLVTQCKKCQETICSECGGEIESIDTEYDFRETCSECGLGTD